MSSKVSIEIPMRLKENVGEVDLEQAVLRADMAAPECRKFDAESMNPMHVIPDATKFNLDRAEDLSKSKASRCRESIIMVIEFMRPSLNKKDDGSIRW